MKNEWVECGLPFSATGDEGKEIELLRAKGITNPDLSVEERTRFGTTREELWEK